MERNQLVAMRHTEMAELMSTLASLQNQMLRVKNTFPKYHQELQFTYNQLLLKAKQMNLMPPWMAA